MQQPRTGPALGWGLGMQPKRLQAAYWREKNSKYIQWDMQVCDRRAPAQVSCRMQLLCLAWRQEQLVLTDVPMHAHVLLPAGGRFPADCADLQHRQECLLAFDTQAQRVGQHPSECVVRSCCVTHSACIDRGAAAMPQQRPSSAV